MLKTFQRNRFLVASIESCLLGKQDNFDAETTNEILMYYKCCFATKKDEEREIQEERVENNESSPQENELPEN